MSNNRPPTADTPDWNGEADFFAFTRGRFVINEKRQQALHAVHFDMNELSRIAADSVGAQSCVHVQKCPDGQYNKAFLFQMDNGREVIGKVPNPNAGLRHYTTASEVATMDFMRNVLSTPAPKVLAWNSRTENNAVGAEYIIMEKATGVPLRKLWGSIKPTDKLKIFLQILSMTKAWTATAFPGYGSLYYASDVSGGVAISADQAVAGTTGDKFVVGPATGRDWCDAERNEMHFDNKGPWPSVVEYRRAVAERELAAIQRLPENPAHMVMITGPDPLYQPTADNKIWSLNAYLRVLEHLAPEAPPDSALDNMSLGRLWHDDLHNENIFVNPDDPTQITSIIDWQSTQIAPLFDHHMDPAIIDYWGEDIGDNLEQPARVDTTGMTDEESAIARAENMSHILMVVWRTLLRVKSPIQYRTALFNLSTAGNILHVARRIYEVGEPFLADLLLGLSEMWPPEKGSFPVVLTPDDVNQIQANLEKATRGIEVLHQLQEAMGGAWPDKGMTTHKEYEEVKAMLASLRDQVIAELYGDNAEAARDFIKSWPFEN